MKNDISAIGNALVDTVFKVPHELIEELGLEIDQMTLSSAEEQAPIISRLIESGAETVSDCGGSATNSLVAAASFGASCFHACKVTNDEDGIRYLESLKAAGVSHKGDMASADSMPTGKCLILVTPDAKRTMTTSLSVSSFMDGQDLDLDEIANSKIFYVEGYMVTSDENYGCVLSVLEHLKSFPEVKIALSLSDPGIVAGFIDKFKEIEAYGLDFIFGNDDEFMMFVGASNIDEAFDLLQSKNYISVITMGEQGSAVISSNEVIKTPRVNIEPVDTNGAGDMFAGSFMFALLQDHDLKGMCRVCKLWCSSCCRNIWTKIDKRWLSGNIKKFSKKLA